MLQRMLQIISIVTFCSISAPAQRRGAPTKVIGAQGAWWVLDDTGVLRTFHGNGTITESALRASGRVTDVTKTPSGVIIALVQGTGGRPARKTAGLVERRANGLWSRIGTIPLAEGESMIGVVAGDSDLAVLSNRAVFRVAGGKVTSRRSIRGANIGARLQYSLARTTAGDLYVGENSGEFGGGLVRISPATGASVRVDRRDTRDLCAGPLNSQCDPVTAVIADPTDRRCVVASIGLRHMLEHGRVLRVCGAEVSVIAELPCAGWKQGQLPCTLGVFGLASDNGGFWASSGPRLLHFRGLTMDGERPVPPLHRVGAFSASTAVPGLLVLSTTLNARASLSGPTILIATRGSVATQHRDHTVKHGIRTPS